MKMKQGGQVVSAKAAALPTTMARKDVRPGLLVGMERRCILMSGLPLAIFITVTSFLNYNCQSHLFNQLPSGLKSHLPQGMPSLAIPSANPSANASGVPSEVHPTRGMDDRVSQLKDEELGGDGRDAWSASGDGNTRNSSAKDWGKSSRRETVDDNADAHQSPADPSPDVANSSSAAVSDGSLTPAPSDRVVNPAVGILPRSDAVPVFPNVTKLRILTDYESLKRYAESSSSSLGSAEDKGGSKSNNCATEAANRYSPSAVPAHNSTSSNKSLDGCSRDERLVKCQLFNLSLSNTELDILLNGKDMYWLDLSGKVPDSVFAHCISCSLEYLVSDAAGNPETCAVARKEAAWCDLWCPLRNTCIQWYRGLLSERTKFGGHTKLGMHVPSHRPYVVIFHDAYVTRDGHVYNDEVVFNSRWRCPRSPFSMAKPERAWEKFRYKKVLVVDFYWRGIYHEIIDALAPMTAYYKELLADPEIMVHVTTDKNDTKFEEFPDVLHRTSHSLEKMMEILGIDRSRLVTGDVYALEVVAVEFSCQNSDPLAMIYLQRLSKIIQRNMLQKGDDHISTSTGDIPIGKGNILVVKRSFNRVIENHDALLASLNHSFTKQVEVYDDTGNLPASEIWGLFHRADLIIAPHGAGLSNVVASRTGTVVYEFLQPFHLDSDPANLNLCYKDLSVILGLRYFSNFPVVMNRPEDYFNISRAVWIEQSTSMVIDVETTVRNVKYIFDDVVVNRVPGVQDGDCPNCFQFAQTIADTLGLSMMNGTAVYA